MKTVKLIQYLAYTSIAILFSTPIWAQDLTRDKRQSVDTETLLSFKLPNNSWRLIGLPINPGSTTLYDIIGDALPSGDYMQSWAIFSYDTLNGRYISPDLSEPLKQGSGYWIIQQTGEDVLLRMPNIPQSPFSVTEQQCPGHGSDCFKIPLMSGATDWNLVGYPFTTGLDWERQVIVTDSGPCADSNGCTPNDADNSGILHNVGFSYNGQIYQQLRKSSQLRPWTGYWLKLYPGATALNPRLLIPHQPQPILEREIGETFDINNYHGEAPFVIEAEKSGGHLYLIGVNHTYDYHSPTFKTIKTMIDHYDIDYVIMEAGPKDQLEQKRKHLESRCASESSSSCPEPIYTFYLADINGIDYTSGEPTEQDQLNHVIESGYSTHDFISLFYTYAVIESFNRRGTPYSEETAKRIIHSRQSSFVDKLGIASDFGYDQWKIWYQEHFGKSLNEQEIHHLGKSIPPFDDGNILHEIAYENDQLRNPSIKKTIDDAFSNGYRNILVEYGNGHMFAYYKNFIEGSTKATFLKYF